MNWNWPNILSTSIIVINAAAAVLVTKDKKRGAISFILVGAVVSGLAIFVQKKEYSSEVPAITASYGGPFVRIIAENVDSVLPLKDVSVNIIGYPAVDLGTMYPQVVNIVRDIETPQKNTTLVATIWYNGTESVEADFDIRVNSDSSVTIETTYLNKMQQPFVPQWKERAMKTPPDSAVRHFNPMRFK